MATARSLVRADGTSHAMGRWTLKRALAIVVMLDVGVTVVACVPPTAVPVQPLPEMAEPANLIDASTYTSKITALRATLARSHVALDTNPVIKTCRGHDTGGCVTCELASRAATGGVDPEMIDGVSIAFATYPSRVLEAAKLEHVALCKTIRQTVTPDGTDPAVRETLRAPAGVAILDDHRLLISVEHFVGVEHVYAYFTIEQVVHHELFHFLDDHVDDKANADPEWHALNAPEFSYRDPAPVASRPAGFVNSYATTNEVEDRASVFEYLIGQPARLCAMAKTDPIVRAKTVVVWKRVARLMGEGLLRQHAACVDWIGGTPKPPAKPRPKPRPAGKPNLRLPASPDSLVGKMR